mgnify:CR=1 FL=1
MYGVNDAIDELINLNKNASSNLHWKKLGFASNERAVSIWSNPLIFIESNKYIKGKWQN